MSGWLMKGKRLGLWAVAAWLWAAAATSATTIREIRVVPVDDVPVSAEQVRAQIHSREGLELDRMALSEDIRAIQRAGVFSYAEVRVETAPDGSAILIYRVAGRPRIRSLRITGADRLGNRKVRNLLEIGSGDLVDQALLGERAQTVRETYRKDFYPDARLTWTLKPVEDSPESVDVDIQVKEGRRAFVRRIHFEGLPRPPRLPRLRKPPMVARKELLKAMTQRQSSWLSWINNDGLYDPGSLMIDREAVRKVFLDRGFLAATVGEPVFTYVGRRKIDVTFAVNPGPLYRLSEWRINGVEVFPVADLERGVVAASDRPAAMEGIRRSAQNLRDFYGSRGYIRTGVEPRVELDIESASASVVYEVREGMLSHIQNIDIRGNAQTKDKVIRREIGVAPGDVFNEVRIRSSESRLKNLGYFSFVNAYPESTAVSNRFNLVFDVEEQRTGQLSLGAGLSSIDNVIGYVELIQSNFDLFGWPRMTGGGQRLRLRAQAGSKRTDLELSLIEPWFLNRRLSLGLDLYRRDARYYSSAWEQVTLGGNLTLGRPVGAFNRVNLIYGLEDIDIRNVSTNASERIQREAVERLKSFGSLELIRDTRNHPFLPTRGFRGSASATLAGGPFGGETDTYQFSLRGSQFFPLWFDHVLNLRGWTSMVQEYGDSDSVPIFDRLFLGGPRSVRAIKYRRLGPKDENNEALGGRSAAHATVEYTLPLFEKVRFAVFYDAGIVWQDLYEKVAGEDEAVGDGVFNDGYGIGVRFDFPGFPIQLDYAWPINTDDVTSDSGRFSFFIGYTY